VNPLSRLVLVVLPLPNRNIFLDSIDKALASFECLLAMRRAHGNNDAWLRDIDSTETMDRYTTV
jgi:hypothetical protein